MSSINCPVCFSSDARLLTEVARISYYTCNFCDVIFVSPEVLSQVDAGNGVVNYTETYWKEELSAARERSWGSALARVAEVFLYARIPIKKFIDIMIVFSNGFEISFCEEMNRTAGKLLL